MPTRLFFPWISGEEKWNKRSLIKIDNLFSTPINFIPFINFLFFIECFWQMRWCALSAIAIMAVAVAVAASSLTRSRAHTHSANKQTIGGCCQRSIVMPSHFLSYDKIIYLLSITSRNKEVDLNYRSLGFCDNISPFRFDFDENRHGKSFSSFLHVFSLLPFIFHLVIRSACALNKWYKRKWRMIKKCQWKIASQPVICWTRSWLYNIFFDVNLLPVFGNDVTGMQAEHKYHRNLTRTHTHVQMSSEKKCQFNLCRENERLHSSSSNSSSGSE